MVDKWNGRFLALADLVASWSKDPSTQVGAVIVREDGTIASVGYNGFPRFVDDSDDLYDNREEKYARMVHAELNAILNAHERLDGCTIFVTHPPCCSCAGAIIQAGITSVIYEKPTPDLLSRWGKSLEQASRMFSEAEIEVIEVVY